MVHYVEDFEANQGHLFNHVAFTSLIPIRARAEVFSIVSGSNPNKSETESAINP